MRLKTTTTQRITLTPLRLYFLIWHYDWYDEKPFANDEEMRLCWEANRDDILARNFEPPSGNTFPPGTRPWAFWYFDQGCQPPFGQAAALDELGLLDPQEKAITIALARAAWLKHSGAWTEPARTSAALATDQQLLDVWPNSFATDYEGNPVREEK
jgi:hypothetical protein